MNFFDEYWTQYENVINSIHNGILADDKEMSDCIIYNNEMLEKFKNKIAMNIQDRKYMKNSRQIYFENKPNTNDHFLNDKINVNFGSEIIIVIISAEIDKIIYSEMIDCYFINLKNKLVEKQNYSSAVCTKKSDSNLKFCLLNTKPEYLKINRPVNNNDEY
jgi:hypothetical protein